MSDGKITRADIIDSIYVKSGYNRNEVRAVLDLIFSEIKEALVLGNSIELRGFGTFESRIRKGREKARNPRTGETVTAHAHRVVAFRSGQELKTAVWKIPPKTNVIEQHET